jgi:hypothetical protein
VGIRRDDFGKGSAMKCFALCLVAIVGTLLMAEAAPAWTVRRYYHPVVVAPAPVWRQPVVVYQPTTVVTTRNRPILGGTVTHARREYRRVVW